MDHPIPATGLRPPLPEHITRMQVELADLTQRMAALTKFVAEYDAYKSLSVEDQALMSEQLSGMAIYHRALLTRLHRAGAEVEAIVMRVRPIPGQTTVSAPSRGGTTNA